MSGAPALTVSGTQILAIRPSGCPNGLGSGRRDRGVRSGSSVHHGPVTSPEALAAEVKELRARVEAAEAVLAVQDLKARYADLVDARYEGGGPVGPERLATLAEQIADLFTFDAVWDGGPALGVAEGRAAIAGRMRAPTLLFSRHLFLSPRIRVDGDRAEARWELLSPCTTADGTSRWLCGYEDDEYFRGEDGRWRHRKMSLTTLFLAPAGDGWRKILSPKK